MQHHQFNSFWYGRGLSPVEWACLSSFIEHGHKVRLFCYDSVTVPEGVSLADASDVAQRDELFLFHGTVAAFTDLFRYKLVSKYGEWWVDTDIYCLKDEIPECRYAWARQDEDLINGAVLKFPANDPALNEIYTAACELEQTFWGEIGPHLLTKHLTGSRFDGHVGKREEFYPVHWAETFLFWLPGCSEIVEEKCRGSYFVHLWTSVFPQIGVNQYRRPPLGSFLERIFGPHVGKFHLDDLAPEKHNSTIESIKRYCNSEMVVSCSERLVGYDVSKFPFYAYTVPCV
jgi:hypothetical protein